MNEHGLALVGAGGAAVSRGSKSAVLQEKQFNRDIPLLTTKRGDVP
jgi:hypothetical protein